ncbi:hypothetical protein SUNI508_13253 [Seiridium unicorne]|uniref:Uncharacterized protein n=1 Tax=Seiridium unicorne TaxID=138068 RepID=A0ABR2VDK3_9PEZI
MSAERAGWLWYMAMEQILPSMVFLDVPVANIVVVPATEDGVAKTVEYANEHHNISFLAVSGGHGAITTVGRMQGGDEIWKIN